jgi:hypothetical protein
MWEWPPKSYPVNSVFLGFARCNNRCMERPSELMKSTSVLGMPTECSRRRNCSMTMETFESVWFHAQDGW